MELKYSSVVKIGVGKRSYPALGVIKHHSSVGARSLHFYSLNHIPTRTTIGYPYLYLSLARSIAKHLAASEALAHLWSMSNLQELRALLPEMVEHYANYYRYLDVKEAQSYDEFTLSPEYPVDAVKRDDRSISIIEAGGHGEGLSLGNISLAWGNGYRTNASELLGLVTGQPIPFEIAD